MAMSSEIKDARTRFYQQESNTGSHLSPAYNQSVMRELLTTIAPHGIQRICDLGSGSGSNLPTLYDLFPKARIVTLDLNQNALIEGRQSFDGAMPAQSDAAAI